MPFSTKTLIQFKLNALGLVWQLLAKLSWHIPATWLVPSDPACIFALYIMWPRLLYYKTTSPWNANKIYLSRVFALLTVLNGYITVVYEHTLLYASLSWSKGTPQICVFIPNLMLLSFKGVLLRLQILALWSRYQEYVWCDEYPQPIYIIC